MGFAPRRTVLCAALAALAASTDSAAVRLDADGLGQALIFPYYTAQPAGGNPLNTYLSVVNHTRDAKAVRVRFREGRMGAETLSFNLFLSPSDVWTGAVVPSGAGTRLITADTSCTDPAFATPSAAGSLPFMDFRTAAFSGANDDGAGTGLDRTREGYVEMIEMATLTGASAAAVTHTFAGSPVNCAAMQDAPGVLAAVPTGGLSGGLTLINVANGMEFPLNAVALADLSTRPFYRQASDTYPDFNAAEIDPVSVVVANTVVYRSIWSRPVDGVSAVMMATTFGGEYVLDPVTASNTDVVATFPTRRFYVTPTNAAPPFSNPSRWASPCQTQRFDADELVATTVADRQGRTVVVSDLRGFDNGFGGAGTFCASSVVFGVTNGRSPGVVTTTTAVLGSVTHGYGLGTLPVPAPFENGWLETSFTGAASTPGLTSLAASVRTDLATGAQASGPHTFRGLPVAGFSVRTFVNGTLTCGTALCQANYAGAFPLRYRRRVEPASVP